jgi:hypothetical protein
MEPDTDDGDRRIARRCFAALPAREADVLVALARRADAEELRVWLALRRLPAALIVAEEVSADRASHQPSCVADSAGRTPRDRSGGRAPSTMRGAVP